MTDIKKEIGYLALVAMRRPSGADLPARKADEIVDVHELHYNRFIYQRPAEAKKQAATTNLRRKEHKPGKVLILDTSLLEEYGLSTEQQMAFAESMMLHWGTRADELKTKLAAGEAEGDKPPVPPRRRRTTRADAPLSARVPRRMGNLARQALVMGAASAIGTIVGNMLTPKSPATPADPARPRSVLESLMSPTADDLALLGGVEPECGATHDLHQVACLRPIGHDGTHWSTTIRDERIEWNFDRRTSPRQPRDQTRRRR